MALNQKKRFVTMHYGPMKNKYKKKEFTSFNWKKN